MHRLLIALVAVLSLCCGCEETASTGVYVEKLPTSMVVREKHLVSYGETMGAYKYWLISEDDRWADVTWTEFCHARVGKEIKVKWREP